MRSGKLVLYPKRVRGIWRAFRRRRGMASGATAWIGESEWLLGYVPWRGWRVMGMRLRGAYSWSWVACPSFRGIDMRKKTVGGPPTAGTSSHLAPMESDVFHRLMSLVSHMAVTRYEDGDPRRTGWITISTVGSSWKVMAKDPDAAAQCTALGGTLDDALALMELLLSSEETPWEPDSFLAKGKKK